MLNPNEPITPFASVIVTVKDDVPVPVGVPETTPVDVLSDSPEGSNPEVIAKR
jgi:hypothetical protein